VRFFATAELVSALEQEKALGKQGKIAYRLMQMDLVILDEPGCLPFTQAGCTRFAPSVFAESPLGTSRGKGRSFLS
jgi:DNA replication protein DnaC